jgi:hypothetical protein
MSKLVRVLLSLCLILALFSLLALASLGPSYLHELPAGIQSLHDWLAQEGPGVIERAQSALAPQ